MKPLIRDRGEYLWVKGATPDGSNHIKYIYFKVYCLVTGRVVYLEEFVFAEK
jgi:hypothetical protein